MIWDLLYFGFFVWILFFGGAERVEGTLFGYFEFGFAGDKAVYIKVLAWVGLVLGLALHFSGVF